MGEKIVDDLLYNNRIVHAYSPTVSEIDITEEQSVEADWFIPVLSSAKGTYIEYWGMTTKSYLENKQRKIEQYKKHNIPVIEIQKNEPFENSDILRVRIMRELKALSKNIINMIGLFNKKLTQDSKQDSKQEIKLEKNTENE